MNLIIGNTGAPRANDSSFPLAANGGIPRAESRVDVRRNQRLRRIVMVQARVGLAANCVVRCGRLQRTLKNGQADRRGNCRGVNRLESRMWAVTLARLAAGQGARGVKYFSEGHMTPNLLRPSTYPIFIP